MFSLAYNSLDMADELITTAEAARRMKRSKRWVQELIVREKLRAEMVGNVYILRARDVANYKHGARGRPSPKKRAQNHKAAKQKGRK